MKTKPDKWCHLLLSKNEKFEANIKENWISNTRFEKLLDATFDDQLTLITIFPKFAKQPVINFMHPLEFPTTSIKINGEYFSIHTFYLKFYLIWMNHNKSINEKVNNLH